MSTVLPRHVICILGNWRDFEEVDAIVRQDCFAGFELDREYSQLSLDARMTASFEASSDRVSPSLTDEDRDAVRTHQAVAYVLSPPVRKERAADISGRAVSLIAALLRAGGLAAKSESAGIAHGRARWLELADDFMKASENGDRLSQGSCLYSAWVRRPLYDEDEGVFYSCGMHLLGERDAEIDADIDVMDALEWIDLLGLYLVADRPARQPQDGEAFRLQDDGPRRVMRFRPCERYEDDDFFFNPYGYIRLEPDGHQ